MRFPDISTYKVWNCSLWVLLSDKIYRQGVGLLVWKSVACHKAHANAANQLISGKFCSLLQSVRLETKSMKWEGVFYWPNKQQQQSNQMNITRLIYYYMNSTTGTLQRLAKHPRLPMSVLEIYFLFCAQVLQPEKPNCITWYLAICLANENHSLTMWLLSSASITEYISSENIWKELDVNEICCMGAAWLELKLPPSLFMQNCEGECFWVRFKDDLNQSFSSSRGHESCWSEIFEGGCLILLGLV